MRRGWCVPLLMFAMAALLTDGARAAVTIYSVGDERVRVVVPPGFAQVIDPIVLKGVAGALPAEAVVDRLFVLGNSDGGIAAAGDDPFAVQVALAHLTGIDASLPAWNFMRQMVKATANPNDTGVLAEIGRAAFADEHAASIDRLDKASDEAMVHQGGDPDRYAIDGTSITAPVLVADEDDLLCAFVAISMTSTMDGKSRSVLWNSPRCFVRVGDEILLFFLSAKTAALQPPEAVSLIVEMARGALRYRAYQ